MRSTAAAQARGIAHVGLLAGNVVARGLRACFDRLLGGGAIIAKQEGDGGALRREQLDNRAPDSAAAAGYNHGLAGQARIAKHDAPLIH